MHRLTWRLNGQVNLSILPRAVTAFLIERLLPFAHRKSIALLLVKAYLHYMAVRRWESSQSSQPDHLAAFDATTNLDIRRRFRHWPNTMFFMAGRNFWALHPSRGVDGYRRAFYSELLINRSATLQTVPAPVEVGLECMIHPLRLSCAHAAGTGRLIPDVQW